MPARKRLVAGNWKMNCTLSEARSLAESIRDQQLGGLDADLVICPPFTALTVVSQVIHGSGLDLGAQNMYFEPKGAFTGEISAEMLLDAGCRYVILGHSERRRQMGETSEQVNRKLQLALASGLTPIVCVGETWPERSSGQTEVVVGQQLSESLRDVPDEQLRSTVIAYEPVWAIGTGHVASPEQAEEVHQFIRRSLPSGLGEAMRILYGGSVTPENAAGLMAKPELDGALVGGASLKAESFAAIARAAAA
ncbi:MAG TPA: triose-phosphate isomerase [Chloroflexota bacterium]